MKYVLTPPKKTTNLCENIKKNGGKSEIVLVKEDAGGAGGTSRAVLTQSTARNSHPKSAPKSGGQRANVPHELDLPSAWPAVFSPSIISGTKIFLKGNPQGPVVPNQDKCQGNILQTYHSKLPVPPVLSEL